MPLPDPDLSGPAAQRQLYRGLGSLIAERAQTMTLAGSLSQTEQLIRAVQGVCQIAMKWDLEVAPILEQGQARAISLENEENQPPGVWLVWPQFGPPHGETQRYYEETADAIESGTQAFDMARHYAALTNPSPDRVNVKAPDGTSFRYYQGGTIHVDLPEKEGAG